MPIPTLDELRVMQVSRIYEMLAELATTNAAQRLELEHLRHWQQQRCALLKQTGRLHRQLEAVCKELDRYHERWGENRE